MKKTYKAPFNDQLSKLKGKFIAVKYGNVNYLRPRKYIVGKISKYYAINGLAGQLFFDNAVVGSIGCNYVYMTEKRLRRGGFSIKILSDEEYIIVKLDPAQLEEIFKNVQKTDSLYISI